MDWLIENREWVFSGIGVVAITSIIGMFFKNKSNKHNQQSIKAGDNSTNIQGSKYVKVKNGKKR